MSDGHQTVFSFLSIHCTGCDYSCDFCTYGACPHLFAEVKTETPGRLGVGADQAPVKDVNNVMWNNEGKMTSQ
jgi:hypothetical protein